MTFTRRNTLKLAWGAPTIALATPAPSYAVSPNSIAKFGQVNSGQGFSIVKSVQPTAGLAGGYIDTRGIGTNGNGLLDPASSTGIWLEGTGNSALIQTVTVQYTFTNQVVVNQNPGSYANVTGKEKWSTPTTLNGWTLTATATTITLTWTQPYEVTISTSTPRSGTYLPGYFVNFSFTSARAGSGRIQTTYTMKYQDADGPDTWTKKTSGTQTI